MSTPLRRKSAMILALAIIGSVLLVLAGYAWDRTLIDRLREINETSRSVESEAVDLDFGDSDEDGEAPDEIMGLARQIERMAQNLQKVEASYRGIVENQIDLICRYRADGTMTFVNSAYAKFTGRKRGEMIGNRFPLLELGYPKRDFQGHFPDIATFEVEQAGHEQKTTSYLWTHWAIKTSAGTTLEFQAVGHDIGARKKVEAALLEAK